MMTAQEILKLIETVDPSDTAKIDEIDARVCCYLNLKNYVSHRRAESMTLEAVGWLTVDTGTPEIISFFSSYCRSRDALKAIRPDGWRFNIYNWDWYGWGCEGNKLGYSGVETPQKMRTEELAELHAIIQAIEYERSQP